MMITVVAWTVAEPKTSVAPLSGCATSPNYIARSCWRPAAVDRNYTSIGREPDKDAYYRIGISACRHLGCLWCRGVIAAGRSRFCAVADR